ncbi:uncharacterized protein E0L32_000553 [Thyridium curvatum]|uniref:Amidase domain-containing protein n=1 Tax=Thyridium curvatum TaxID=1093900 RepID=A0A507B9U0_9PEZI|nr:uncharacterized protein E0L32_000553 [Thyridium curvatum]TPX14159.1 hypothetical protein E0L32_000553 [Thyridium curvatum]
MQSRQALDLLTATAGDLRNLLEVGEYTSVQLVEQYLKQIARHNHQGMKLNAMISTRATDAALAEAHEMDVERLKSGARSRLHGIPIIVKDLICTPSFGMGTTSGSLALQGLNASIDAPIATMLKNAGCVLIRKSNLSEWGNSKGSGVTSGWSAIGGQTQSPYVEGGVDHKDKWMGHSTPGGSSSGSAVGTAAGFAPLGIGTEADGSIVQPAIRAALYAIKATVGDVEDCADVLEILLPGRDFRSHLKKSWDGVSIAYLDYEEWQFPDAVCDKTPAFDEQHKMEMSEALTKAESLGAKVTFNAPLMSMQEVVGKYDTVQMGQIARHQLRPTLERFLALFDDPKLRKLEDLVEFNKQHASQELPPEQPSQQVLENGLSDNITDAKYEQGLRHLRQSMRDSIEKCLAESKADVIMASGESLLTSIAAVAGYPIASVPLGFSTLNGRPSGMEIMARNGDEEKIFEVMSAWEVTFPDGRRPPPLLAKWEASL